jgi:hypothetical protein
VGFNATKPMPFWTYWNDGHGFNRDLFLSDYLRIKNRRRPVGTRARLEEISRVLPCLETNIHAVPSKTRSDLKAAERSTEVFRFLFREIQPALVWAHGKDACRFFEHETDCGTCEGNLQKADWMGHRFHLFGSPHLSRSVSLASARHYAQELASLINETPEGRAS